MGEKGHLEGRREWSSAPLPAKGSPFIDSAILRIVSSMKGGPLAHKGVELRSLLPSPEDMDIHCNAFYCFSCFLIAVTLIESISLELAPS